MNVRVELVHFQSHHLLPRLDGSLRSPLSTGPFCWDVCGSRQLAPDPETVKIIGDFCRVGTLGAVVDSECAKNAKKQLAIPGVFLQLLACVVILFILDVRLLVDAPAGVTQEEGQIRFFHLSSAAVLALVFIARRIQPSVSLFDREVEFCLHG